MSAFVDLLASRHPLLWRLVQLTGAAAFGSALPDLLALARRVLS